MNSDTRTGCGMIFLITGILLMLTLFVYGFAAFDAHTWKPWAMNQEYRAVRQSNSYVTTQQAIINDVVNQFNSLGLQIAQLEGTPTNQAMVDQLKRGQVSQVERACAAANGIRDSQIPQYDTIAPLMQKVSCWYPDSTRNT